MSRPRVRATTQAPDEAAADAYVRFRLGRIHFAVPASAARRVMPAQALAPIPLAPPTVLGAVNVRGRVALCLDPRQLIPGHHAPAWQLLALVHDGADIALAVDSVDAVTRPARYRLIPPDGDATTPPQGFEAVTTGRLDRADPADDDEPDLVETRQALRQLMAAVEAQSAWRTKRDHPDPLDAVDAVLDRMAKSGHQDGTNDDAPEGQPDHEPLWLLDLGRLIRRLGGQA